MATQPTTVKAYLDTLPADRRTAIRAVRAAVNKGLPKGYKEGIQYGMIGWFVPHSIYPAGYHCDPSQPLPFASLASQKNYMSLYLVSVYGDKKQRTWFEKEWAKSGKRLNMGKSCVRFKSVDDIPLDVITRVISRVPVKDLVAHYEAVIPARGKKKTASKARKKTSRRS